MGDKSGVWVGGSKVNKIYKMKTTRLICLWAALVLNLGACLVMYLASQGLLSMQGNGDAFYETIAVVWLSSYLLLVLGLILPSRPISPSYGLIAAVIIFLAFFECSFMLMFWAAGDMNYELH